MQHRIDALTRRDFFLALAASAIAAGVKLPFVEQTGEILWLEPDPASVWYSFNDGPWNAALVYNEDVPERIVAIKFDEEEDMEDGDEITIRWGDNGVFIYDDG